MIDWSTWKSATCSECWCEATRTGSMILEPVNTWTNLIFIFAGFVFIFRAEILTIKTNKLTSLIIFPRIYGFAMIFLGMGSFFYHASQTFAGQWFDVFGMYLVSMFYISYNFFRIGRFNKNNFIFFYLSSCFMLGLIIYLFPESRRWLFGVSIAFTFVQCIWIQKQTQSIINRNYLIGAVIVYVMAQTVWVLDKNRIWCNPHAWMNGHGIWHLFTGVAAILIYFYFNSEKAPNRV